MYGFVCSFKKFLKTEFIFESNIHYTKGHLKFKFISFHRLLLGLSDKKKWHS